MDNTRIMVGEPEQSLSKKTRLLMSRSNLTLIQIYHATGIPYEWQQKFKSGNIKNPSVNRVQRLYEFLSGKKLAV